MKELSVLYFCRSDLDYDEMGLQMGLTPASQKGGGKLEEGEEEKEDIAIRKKKGKESLAAKKKRIEQAQKVTTPSVCSVSCSLLDLLWKENCIILVVVTRPEASLIPKLGIKSHQSSIAL